MKYVLVLLLLNSCAGPFRVDSIGIYETRESCENQKDVLNKYHNTQHFLCIVDKSS